MDIPFPEKKVENAKEEWTREKIKGMALNISTQSTNYLYPMDRAKELLKSSKLLKGQLINWPDKLALSTPKAVSSGYCNITDRYFAGTNFATQDYMGMCGNEESIRFVADAMRKLGTHSGGIPGRMGYNESTEELVQTLEWYFDEVFGKGRSYEEIGQIRKNVNGENDTVQKCHAQVYSAGWLAGYGAIQALVQPCDYIVMDELGHNCLKEGAKASLANLVLHKHLDIDDLEKKIKELRAKDKKNSILVVTESLFSMDSDCPDLDRTQRVAKENNAILLIDSAHDMFATGSRGRGHMSDRIKDFSNVLVLGSGSKSLSSNFGYVVTGNKKLMDLLHVASHSWTHSDTLPPAVAALVSHNIKVMGSELGFEKRKRLRENAQYFHDKLHESHYETIGFASPIIIVYIGSELISRVIANTMYYEGVIVNSVEFPAVETGKSRLRIQLQSEHTKDQIDHFVDRLNAIMPKVEEFLENDSFSNVVAELMIEQMMEMSKNKKAKL